MTETPTQAETPPARDGGFNMPKLPVGWEYEVKISGPESQKIVVSRFGGMGGPTGVFVEVTTGVPGASNKTIKSDSLADGVRTAADLVRTLRELSEHERKSKATREALLAQMGRPSPEDEDVEPDPVQSV